MKYRVNIDIFEGPFDLLVYLIETARMDIYDIEIAEITGKYMNYISEMQDMKIDVATEFIVLAATLVDIKSKMLLPKLNKDGEVSEEQDPRGELVDRLLEYKKFKAASEFLADCEEEAANVFSKPQEDISEYESNPDETLMLDAGQFIKAFTLFINRKEKMVEIKKRYDKVPRQKISAEARTRFIEDMFRGSGNEAHSFFETCEDGSDRYDVALSFVTVMELIKERKLTAEQKRLFGDIILKTGSRFNGRETEKEGI